MRIFLFISSLILISLSVIYFFGESMGYVTLQWLNLNIEINALALCSMVVLLVFFLVKITEFAVFIAQIPTSVKKCLIERKENEDNEILISSFVSSITENIDLIKKNAKKLESKLGHKNIDDAHSSVILLLARTYEILYKNDPTYEEKLESLYIQLTTGKEFKLFAYRGLIKIRIAKKRYHDALYYAEKAFENDSKSQWIIDNLIKIYMVLEEYEKAEKMILKSLKMDYLAEEEVNKLLLICYVNHANLCITDSEAKKAINLLEKALKIDPAYPDAVFTLARLYSQDEEKKEAYKVVEKAWKKVPSRELAKFILNIYSSFKLTKQVKMLENLISISPETKDAYIVLAELYLENNMLEDARQTMDRLLVLHAPDSRMSRIMAAIETKSQNSYSVINSWLEKIL